MVAEATTPMPAQPERRRVPMPLAQAALDWFARV
jgi:hypothetical protein